MRGRGQGNFQLCLAYHIKERISIGKMWEFSMSCLERGKGGAKFHCYNVLGIAYERVSSFVQHEGHAPISWQHADRQFLDVLVTIDRDNLTNAQVVAILKKVVYYLVKHIEQEGM
jgi:hypothetical protein